MNPTIVLICLFAIGSALGRPFADDWIRSIETDEGNKGNVEIDGFQSPDHQGVSAMRVVDPGPQDVIHDLSSKFHAMVNKAHNAAMDAIRFTGESIHEQEHDTKDRKIRFKRDESYFSGINIIRDDDDNDEDLSTEADLLKDDYDEDSEEKARKYKKDDQEGKSEAEPMKVMQGFQEEKEEAVEDDTVQEVGEEKETGNQKQAGEVDGDSGNEINSEKIDEMIDLMNSLNQKFAKMITSWDNYAAAKDDEVQGRKSDVGAKEEGREAEEAVEVEGESRKRMAKKEEVEEVPQSRVANEGGDVEAVEEGVDEEEMEEEQGDEIETKPRSKFRRRKSKTRID